MLLAVAVSLAAFSPRAPPPQTLPARANWYPASSLPCVQVKNAGFPEVNGIYIQRSAHVYAKGGFALTRCHDQKMWHLSDVRGARVARAPPRRNAPP